MLPEATTPRRRRGWRAAVAAYFPALGSRRNCGSSTAAANPARSGELRPVVPVHRAAGEAPALLATGLDPGIGILHGDAEHRPSLALDLLEELRPMVVDQVVLEAARQGQLSPEHARTEEGRTGVMLTRAGRQALLDGYERRMLQTTRGALPDFTGTIRRHVYRQAQRLRTAIAEAAAMTARRPPPGLGSGDDRHRRVRRAGPAGPVWRPPQATGDRVQRPVSYCPSTTGIPEPGKPDRSSTPTPLPVHQLAPAGTS